MASGDTLLIFGAYSNQPSSASFASLDTRNQHVVLDFDASTSENAVFSAVLPQAYAGGGLETYVHTSFSTATAGSAVVQIYFERIGNEQQDVDVDNWGPNSSLVIDVPFTSGSVNIASINIANGASIASIAVGEKFRVRVQRDCNNATDNASGDLELHNLELREV